MLGPCDPVNVTSMLQCGSGTAMVSWEAGAGAMYYTAHARDFGSRHYTYCTSNTTSCQLRQLRCGGIYNLTVASKDATCNSSGSTGAVLTTGKKTDLYDMNF